MKRYHEEKHIVENRAKLFRQLNSSLNSDYTPTAGKFRKSLRCSGCGKARCQLCHPEKYPKRVLTLKERQIRDIRVNDEND